jgi:signal transduction histidine kinase
VATDGPDPTPDPTAPLWRSAQLFRLLSCVYALGFQIAVNSDLRHPALGWLLFALLIGWSAACGYAYVRGFGRRSAWVIAELVVVLALMLSTEVIASGQWAHNNQTWPTTLWVSNATISAALQFGPTGGMLTGVAVAAASEVVRGYINVNLGRNATIIVELAVGLAVGMAARTARHAHDELQRAARLSAAVEERERLSRQVHDGVIQVLALVTKRGHEIGGATSELAKLAGEQERALRSWVTSTEMETDAKSAAAARQTVDLRALLRRREADLVSMSLPGTAVLLEGGIAAELDAAVGNALDNVRAHAGPGARAYVLLEDLGDSVTVSIRDDGVGISPGRLEEAVDQGHVGISKSIVGRLMSLSGTAELHTDVGEGTEWELSVPRRGNRD